MNITYENLDEILLSDDFKREYVNYKKKIKFQKLIDFLDNIENNKNYYHLNVNKKKIFKKSNNDDTIVLKKINNLINKITDKTFKKIKCEIIILMKEKDYLHSIIIENLIDISITNKLYIELYVDLMITINNKREILKYCNKYYNIFFNEEIEKNDSKYLQLCNVNKRTDNIIGYSLLISYLEKHEFVENYIKKILDNFFNELFMNNLNDIEFFQYLLSIETIFTMHSNKLNENYIQKLNHIKGDHGSSKIRFKIMDILNE